MGKSLMVNGSTLSSITHWLGQTYLALSAPFVSRVLINNSWPYLAAIWRGVFPYISTQSISPPVDRGRRAHYVIMMKCFSCGADVLSQSILWGKTRVLSLKCVNVLVVLPFWIRIWEPVKRPCIAATCKGLFPSLFYSEKIKAWSQCKTIQ